MLNESQLKEDTGQILIADWPKRPMSDDSFTRELLLRSLKLHINLKMNLVKEILEKRLKSIKEKI